MHTTINKKIQLLFTATLFLLWSCNNKKTTQNNAPASVKYTTVQATNDSITTEETPRKETINLFRLDYRDSIKPAFVSLSDIYPIYEEADSLALPNIENMGVKNAGYFTLEKKYRNRFLSKTNIAETDSVFIYDYAKNKLISFTVKNLKAVAMINIYMSEQDFPYRRPDYQIGFEINKQYLKGFSNYYVDVLVYVGKENPFAQQQLKPTLWKKITGKEHSFAPVNKDAKEYLQNIPKGNRYLYQTDSLQYFLQEYLDSGKEVCARHLQVANTKTKQVIIEKVFRESEGTSPAPLNYQNQDGELNQWTGKLLKNKPPVVFGFEYVSFGCQAISVIDASGEDIYIQCDNRH